jgi:hypothetical protein
MINEHPGAVTPRETCPSTVTGTFAAVVPLPMRFARAKHWSRRALAGKFDAAILRAMRLMERANQG